MSYLLSLKLLSLLVGFVIAFAARRVVASRRRNPRRLPYPPGPKGKPFVGNLAQFPRMYAFLGFHEISKEYGDMVYLRVLGKDMLILSSIKRITDLLEKRAVHTSNRSQLPTVELGGMGWNFAAMPYGNRWRQYRRAFHQHFNQLAIPRYHPIMQEEASIFLGKLKDDPAQWVTHLRSLFGTAIMRATYGFDDIGKNNSLIEAVESLIKRLSLANIPGRYLVNSFPLLKHVPEWMPGAGFQRELREIAELNQKILNTPFEEARAKMAGGQKGLYPSMTSALVESLPDETHPDNTHAEHMARGICAVSYIAGSETSIAAAMALVCALANNPQVQKKAQAELDAVIGTDRLPLMKELTRWFSPAPLAVPHSTMEDDEYDGYFIPKGTTMFANVWSIMHDPELFERPFEFTPERYLKEGKADSAVIDPESLIFGFGRRICPGRHFAEDVLFVFAASIISSFEIGPPKDQEGNPVEVKLVTRETGSVAMPYPFECFMTPRPQREPLLG
ncbi:cytochrome P450 [Coprinellus micaceus]|uniref:Cytochrome P450 n=1 Tax=Coprinellus micaceus TaxID=71717 RepID=A0A4Y7T670_COPMI|nr:cytochrome P450 [Coprinellus micaceus]